MAGKKKEVYKPKPMTENKRNLIQGLFEEYDIQTADDIQEALKDHLLSGTIQEMMEAEMDDHLGYDKYERSEEPNYRNGKRTKSQAKKASETKKRQPFQRQESRKRLLFEEKVILYIF